jgi:hypothetical protein
VDVVGSQGIIEDVKTVSLLGFKEPMEPTPAVF